MVEVVLHRLWILPTLLIAFSCTTSQDEFVVTGGTVEVPAHWSSEIVPLSGSWEVYVGARHTPDSPTSPSAPSYSIVPPVRGRYYAEDDRRFVSGPITYKLTLNSVPRAPLLAVSIPPTSGDTTAWVNGESSGTLRGHSIVPLLPDDSGVVNLTIVIDGHHYPREGITLWPPRIGPISELHTEAGRRVFWNGILVGILLILAAYHLIIRLTQSPGLSRNVPTLTIGGVLALLAVRILLLEGTMFLSSVPWLAPGVYLRLRGFTVYPLAALYLRFLIHMFPGESQRSPMRMVERASWVWLLVSLLIPARWWMDLLFAWLPILVVALGSAVVTLFRACRSGRNSAHLLVVAMAVLTAGITLEVARAMTWISAQLMPIPLTVVLFGILSSLALSRRIFDSRLSLANLREQAQHDGLTGLYNRRTLDVTLEEEWLRHMRSGDSLAGIMVDIDYFKQYNDTLGHQAGDTVLQEVARTLTEHAQRATDIVTRYGGEEFFLLLPSTTASDAYLLAERIRGTLRSKALPHPVSEEAIVTVSIGVTAVIPEHDEHGPRGARSLVEAADRALYDAKRGGRDAVRTASAEENTRSRHRAVT
jgi:diguanylate cyclase (GGDEF)-like protein